MGPRFPLEVTEFRVKTFFFGNHLTVKGTKIPFKGRELWVKTVFFFFGDDNIPTVGKGPTLGKAAHIKLQSFFAQNLNKKFYRRSEKRLSRKRNCISYRAIKRSATILSYDTAILSHF